jgi:sugar phosphate isomerase/epimerase
MAEIPIALQMFTLRNEAAADFIGTLRKVAAMGFAGVEFAGHGGLSPTQLRKLIADIGIKVCGSHVGVEALTQDPEKVLDFNEALGNSSICAPSIPASWGRTPDDWKRTAERFNGIGAACKARGMRFCYHNHAFEFELVEGKRGIDVLFDTADPALVNSELDTYWVQYGGCAPASYVRKLAGRIPLLHIKDMAAGSSRTFTEIGEGIMNFKAIFEEAEQSGTEWYIVEQDVCPRPPLESVEISLRNLKEMGMV